MAEIKMDKLTPNELKLALRAIAGLKASVIRAKTKEMGDEDMVRVYEARIGELDRLAARISNGALF